MDKLLTRIRSLFMLGLGLVLLASYVSVFHVSTAVESQISNRDAQIDRDVAGLVAQERLGLRIVDVPRMIDDLGYTETQRRLSLEGFELSSVVPGAVVSGQHTRSVSHGGLKYYLSTLGAPGVLNAVTLPTIEPVKSQYLAQGLSYIGYAMLTCLGICWLMRRQIYKPIERLLAAFEVLRKGGMARMDDQRGTAEEQLIARHFNETVNMVEIAQARQMKSALTDSLTGLPNRAALIKRLETYSKDASAALLFIDLDDFKRVNDVFGHTIGDETLRIAAARIGERVRFLEGHRSTDMVARIGGDEFVVLLSPQPQQSVIDLISERIIQGICEVIHIENREIFIGASIGQAVSDQARSFGDQLLKRGDMAMYVAKESGKRSFAAFNESLEKDAERMNQVEAHLRHAIERNELHLVYQPIVHCDGMIAGFETLVRWVSAELGSVSPAEFIPIAEAYGMIEELDLWIAEKAMREIYAASLGWDRLPFVSINVSGTHFVSQRFVDKLLALAERENYDTGLIHIEITETAILTDKDNARYGVERLREAGFKVYLDDFGTGFSSLSHLADFPLDGIKIDVSFVRDIPALPSACKLTQGVIALAHSLDLEVVAEGVERGVQRTFLTENGSDLLQGFYFGKGEALPDSLSAPISVQVAS